MTLSMEAVHTILDELRSSVAALQTANDGLRKELQGVKRELRVLRQNTGSLFPKFALLPPEVRRMIWHSACRFPQLHILNEKAMTSGQIRFILNSCAEGRAAVHSLQLDYFTIPEETSDAQGSDDGTRAVKIYANLDIDTIWINEPIEMGFRPICGKCGQDAHGKNDCPRCSGPSPLIKRVAINFGVSWPTTATHELRTAEYLWFESATELCFVVGDYDPVVFDPLERGDIGFITPLSKPATFFIRTPNFMHGHTVKWTDQWETIEDSVVRHMEYFKAERAQDRKDALNSGDVTQEELDLMDEDGNQYLRDYECFQIPKVKFVQVQEARKDWVFRPRGLLR